MSKDFNLIPGNDNESGSDELLAEKLSIQLGDSIRRQINSDEISATNPDNRDFLELLGLTNIDYTQKYEGQLTIELDTQNTEFPAAHLLIEYYLKRIDIDGKPTENYRLTLGATLSYTLPEGAANFVVGS
ncbi:MAG: hypothetical protein Q9M91_03575 [Candidatus Dojkabacteria bacterium]|nr:hypothetical protein [Candidatus Dojkabacteria bacterium]MDQ7020900.1 hypothetical protein [Candidatus Dojkabacteria bacterium]